MKVVIKVIFICFYILVIQDALASIGYFTNTSHAVDNLLLVVNRITYIPPASDVGLQIVDATVIENDARPTGAIGGTGRSPIRTGGIGGTGNSTPTGGIGGTGHVPSLPDFADIPHIPDIPEVPRIPDIPEVPDIADIPGVPDIPMNGTTIIPDIPE